jgi:hypothetical protein
LVTLGSAACLQELVAEAEVKAEVKAEVEVEAENVKTHGRASQQVR